MEVLAIDIETACRGTGLNDAQKKEEALDWQRGRIVLLGYYNETRKGTLCTPEDMAEFLNTEIKNGTKFIFQNGKFDQKYLYHHTGVWVPSFFDTYIAASILQNRPKRLGLETLVGHYLGLPPYKEDEVYADMNEVDPEVVRNLCLIDCEHTFNLARHLSGVLREENLYDFFHAFMMPLGNIIARMEYNGIAVNKELLMNQFEQLNLKHINLIERMKHDHKEITTAYAEKKLQEYITDHEEQKPAKRAAALEKYGSDPVKLERAYARIEKPLTETQLQKVRETEFNFSSPKQVLWALSHVGINPKNMDGKDSTAELPLVPFKGKHPLVDDLLELRGLEKLLGYYQKWQELIKDDGKIHASFNADQGRIRTGRLSSSNPNMQQVPKGEPRQLFVSEPGTRMVVIDFAQIEPRVVAQLSGDPSLIEAFTTGEDFYSVIIKGVLKLKEEPAYIHKNMKDVRDLGKNVALSILYGIGPNKLAATIRNATGKDMNAEQARDISKNYFNAFPGLLELRKKVSDFITKHGFIRNIFGRHVIVEEEDIHHTGVNSLVQSSASDLCIASQIILQREIAQRGMKAWINLLVHDEVVYTVAEDEVDEFLRIATECMTQRVIEMVKIKSVWQVPLAIEAKVGDNWGIK